MTVITLTKTTTVRSSTFATLLSTLTVHRRCSSGLSCAATKPFSTSFPLPARIQKMPFPVVVPKISSIWMPIWELVQMYLSTTNKTFFEQPVLHLDERPRSSDHQPQPQDHSQTDRLEDNQCHEKTNYWKHIYRPLEILVLMNTRNIACFCKSKWFFCISTAYSDYWNIYFKIIKVW